MIDKKILTSVPYLSSVLHLSYTKSYELVEGLKTIPQNGLRILNMLNTTNYYPLRLDPWLYILVGREDIKKNFLK